MSPDIKTNVGRTYQAGRLNLHDFLIRGFSVAPAAGGTWIVNIIDSIMIMILVSLADKARVTIFDLARRAKI